MEKKIYIEFCNFDFSILSATPLGKISIGTAKPSLLETNQTYQKQQKTQRTANATFNIQIFQNFCQIFKTKLSTKKYN